MTLEFRRLGNHGLPTGRWLCQVQSMTRILELKFETWDVVCFLLTWIFFFELFTFPWVQFWTERGKQVGEMIWVCFGLLGSNGPPCLLYRLKGCLVGVSKKVALKFLLVDWNQLLVTNELVDFDKYWLEVHNFRRITDHFRGTEKCSNQQKIIERSQQVTSWTWKHWDFVWLCPKISRDQCPGRILDIIGQYPSTSHANRLHVNIFQFSFIKRGILFHKIPLQWVGDFPEVLNSNWLFLKAR